LQPTPEDLERTIQNAIQNVNAARGEIGRELRILNLAQARTIAVGRAIGSSITSDPTQAPDQVLFMRYRGRQAEVSMSAGKISGEAKTVYSEINKLGLLFLQSDNDDQRLGFLNYAIPILQGLEGDLESVANAFDSQTLTFADSEPVQAARSAQFCRVCTIWRN
jgi:hypothetical protein